MAQEIEYAVREAFGMQLSKEQSIKFVMRMAKVDRDVAKQAMQQYQQRVMMAH